jgi:hypothetical protein
MPIRNAYRFLASLLLCGTLTGCPAPLEMGAAAGYEGSLSGQFQDFVQALQAKHSLARFMNSNGVEFVYHGDDRCYGTFHGATRLAEPRAIDRPIRLPMTRDGQGWETGCAQAGSYQETIEMTEFASLDCPAEFMGCNDRTAICQASCGAFLFIELGFERRNGTWLVRRVRLESTDPG